MPNSRRRTALNRTALLAIGDAFVAVLTLLFAFILRFEGHPPPEVFTTLLTFSPIALVLLFSSALLGGLYRAITKYMSLREILRLGAVVTLTAFGLIWATLIYYFFFGTRPIPLSVPVIWAPFLFFGLAGPRLSPRLRAELLGDGSRWRVDTDRVLIVGAGDAGERIAREMLANRAGGFAPIGFVDDDPRKQGRKLHGLPVFGPITALPAAVAKHGVDQVVIAMPSAPSRVIREVLNLVAQTGLKVRTLPSLAELMGAKATSADVRDVDIGDLIARSQVKPDMEQVASIVKGRTVLVTGAAGSIGSELARQVLYCRPSKLLLLDTNETDLYTLDQRLASPAKSRGPAIEMLIADIRDHDRMHEIFLQHRPHLVFHAAAYKHVPVMELHPSEAVKTNVFGTMNVAEAARSANVERFVLVSTDKAVNPTSVMGATKRLAEMVINLVGAHGSTIFSSVRFGNVLASRGSVVPLFAQQVRDGGPITVTHPEVTRYFMTIEEAVALICQAAALGRGRETFVLEMGEPVKIMDLARKMRALMANGSSEEVAIIVTGLRTGEKLHEDLWNSGETLLPIQPGIMRVADSDLNLSSSELITALDELKELTTAGGDRSRLVKLLFSLASGEVEPRRVTKN